MYKQMAAALLSGTMLFCTGVQAQAALNTSQYEIIQLDMWSHLKHKIFGGHRKDDDKHREKGHGAFHPPKGSGKDYTPGNPLFKMRQPGEQKRK